MSEETQSKRDVTGEERLLRLDSAIAAVVEQQRRLLDAMAILSARIKTDAAPPVDPLVELKRAVEAEPKSAEARNRLGLKLSELQRHAEAEVVYRAGIALNPLHSHLHNNLGWSLDKLGQNEAAEASYRAALNVDGHQTTARTNLSNLLARQERFDDALALWQSEIDLSPHDPEPLRTYASIALEANRWDVASDYALRYAAHRWGTRYWPEKRSDDPPFARVFSGALKSPKLRHDIEQLKYLRANGIVGNEAEPILEGYARALERVAPVGDLEALPMSLEERATIGHVYNRIMHLGSAPRVAKALSYDWDMAAIEEKYVTNPPGIIAIDRLLSDDAMSSLRRFCLESTIWSRSNYDNGYLGAFMVDGFNSPLLFQIAEELRAAMPRVIGDRPLMAMWGFKYDQEMSGISLHADFAAVNVNFWITPDDANLDPESGGLVVYDAEAPMEWNFSEYNQQPEKIEAFLKEKGAKAVTFPYKQNRAVIFNSDLFHHTAPFKFKPGYENRRINVTMLFGTRADKRSDARPRLGGRTE